MTAMRGNWGNGMVKLAWVIFPLLYLSCSPSDQDLKEHQQERIDLILGKDSTKQPSGEYYDSKAPE